MDVPLDEEAQERVDRCKRDRLCVACLKPVPAGEKKPRGMCKRCYATTWRLIKAGRTTEEERVRAGKMLPAKSGGRPPSNPVTKEFCGDGK